jgi:hypothetical protein
MKKWLKSLAHKLGPCSQGLHDYAVVKDEGHVVRVQCKLCGKKTTAVE